MNVKKTIRKLVALGTGATMVGATIMGAMADLSMYPEPFVKDGVVDTLIAVGSEAKTMDTLGAIDIAASLQSKAVTPVSTGGSVGTTTIVGDHVQIETGSNLLDIHQELGDVRKTLTENELGALAGGSINAGGSSTNYKQYLRLSFNDIDGNLVNSSVVKYDQDNRNDVTSDFLVFNNGEYFVEYQMDFTEGLDSDVDTSYNLEDIVDESINIFGNDFTFTEATRTAGTTEISLTLMRGEISDTLGEGETKTYTVDGADYEVTAVFISDQTSESVKFSVNGELTKELTEGETDIVQGDMEIGVRAILTNQREGIAEFYLGADKVKLTDTAYDDDSFAASGVEIGGESITDAKVKIKAANASATKITINSIYYQIKADAASGTTIYVPPGYGVKEYMDESEAMLNPTWDIKYEGVKDIALNELIFQPSGDDAYSIEIVNVNGDVYDLPFVDNQQGTMKLGEYDSSGEGELWFTEDNTTNRSAYHIGVGDYFIVTDRNDDQGVTNVLQYDDIDTTNHKITVSDLAGGTYEITFNATGTDYTTGGVNCNKPQGDLIVGGNTYTIYVCGNATLGYNLSLDHNGDGDVTYGERVYVVTKGGAMLHFNLTNAQWTGSNCYVGSAGDSCAVDVIVPARLFDEQGPFDTSTNLVTGPLTQSIDIEERASNEVGIGFNTTSFMAFKDDQDNRDYQYGLDPYGGFWTMYNPSGSSSAESLTIEIPDEQRGAEVFITAGAIQTTKTTSGGEGAVVVNEAAVGIGVLDSDVELGQGNLIVVGGPCVNTLAMELMENPENCAEGFEPGKAVIKLYEDDNALLVAGYGWEDTLGAAYVLKDYEDYELSGTEVEVIVADLDSLEVRRVE